MLKGKNRKCLRSGLRSDWSRNSDSGNTAGCDFFQYVVALHKLHRNDQRTVKKHFMMSISFCQLLDDLFKF